MFRFSQFTLYVLAVSVRLWLGVSPVTADSSASVSVSQRPSAHASPASCSISAGWGAPSTAVRTCSGSDGPATSTASEETERDHRVFLSGSGVCVYNVTLPPSDRRTSPVIISQIATPRSLSGAEPILPPFGSQSPHDSRWSKCWCCLSMYSSGRIRLPVPAQLRQSHATRTQTARLKQ